MKPSFGKLPNQFEYGRSLTIKQQEQMLIIDLKHCRAWHQGSESGLRTQTSQGFSKFKVYGRSIALAHRLVVSRKKPKKHNIRLINSCKKLKGPRPMSHLQSRSRHFMRNVKIPSKLTTPAEPASNSPIAGSNPTTGDTRRASLRGPSEFLTHRKPRGQHQQLKTFPVVDIEIQRAGLSLG